MPIDDECYYNSPSAADEGEKMDSIKGINRTVESSSVVLGKRIRTDEGDGSVMLNEINREVKKPVKGNNYTQLTKDLEYKNDGESESDNNHDVKNLLKDKNDTELEKDLEYKNDGKSDRVWNYCLDSINGSNKTVESPSVVLGKRKRTDEGDGAVASKIIPWELYRIIQDALKLHKKYTQLTKDLECKNDRELKKALEDTAVNLERCENRVKYLVKKLKLLNQLPVDWEYNPATASTYVFPTIDNLALKKLPPPMQKSEAAASKTIPSELHLLIQDALGFRADVMLNKLQREATELDWGYYYDVQLKQCEDRIRFLAKRFKKLKQLPDDWEYDPATASTFVAAEEDTSALPETPPPEGKCLGCCSWEIDPYQIFPKTTDVPLDEEEKKIWKGFKEFDKYKRGLNGVDFNTVDKYKIPLLADNPIVRLTSKFAVTAFNEAIEMYVKKGEQNNIHGVDIVECKYLKLYESSYYFYITIEAFEERERGIYDTKVKLNWDDGSKSLMHFLLTDRKPHVLKETTKRETDPGSWQDCSDIPHSGMRPRRNKRSICRGYDYRTPWGHGGP